MFPCQPCRERGIECAPLPVSRYAECKACDAANRVCKAFQPPYYARFLKDRVGKRRSIVGAHIVIHQANSTTTSPAMKVLAICCHGLYCVGNPSNMKPRYIRLYGHDGVPYLTVTNWAFEE